MTYPKRKTGPKPGPRIACPCPICGIVQMKTPSRVKDRVNSYCSRLCRDIGHQKHGETHDGVLSPEYKIWRSIKNRCFNTKDIQYHYYGGRGITLYPPWREDFQAFLAAVGRRPSPELTLERMNNALGYVPGNLQWATRKEQARNTRRNRLLTLNGIAQPVAVWLEDPAIIALGLTRSIINWRLAEGWEDAHILMTPRGFRSPTKKKHQDTERNLLG